MVTAEGETREFPIAKLPITIGRAPDAKLRVPVDSVSRHHCELFENDDEELAIRDLKSSNGTYVNRERIKDRELVPGDLLSVGPVVFVVKIDGHPADVDPKTAFIKGVVAVGGGADQKPDMIDGVPTWSAPPRGGLGRPGGGLSAKPGAGAAPRKGPPEDEGFESLLKDLSESDFDIKMPDDDDKPPPSTKKQ